MSYRVVHGTTTTRARYIPYSFFPLGRTVKTKTDMNTNNNDGHDTTFNIIYNIIYHNNIR